MIDIRIVEKMAKELIDRKEKLMFYLIVPNGNLVERKIEPVSASDEGYTFFSDVRTTYRSSEKITLENFKKIKLERVDRSNGSTLSNENGFICNKIEELLKSGYKLIED